MKIAIATAVYYPMINGVAMFSHNLAVGLAKRGHEVIVLCPSQTGRNYTRMIDDVRVYYLKSTTVKVYPDQIHKVPPKKKVLGVEIPHIIYKYGFKVSVFPARQIAGVLDRFRPDVIHVQVSDPIGLSCVSYGHKHGIPVVTTEHNQPEVITEPLHVPRLIKRPIDSLLAAYFINRQSKSDYVTMPTRLAIEKLIGERNFEVPIEAVSNGVDLVNFKPGKAKAEIYQKYGIPADKKVILYVGRVDPEKKVLTVLEAFRRFYEASDREAVLVVVGDGVDKARLASKVKECGLNDAVLVLGKVLTPDLYELYRAGDVFVTASEIETQGIVLIEAAAVGLPLIAVNAGAVAEVCRNGENGILCKPGDVDGIAEAMKMLIADDEMRKEYGKKSIKIASEHDFEKTLDKFIQIYKKVVTIK